MIIKMGLQGATGRTGSEVANLISSGYQLGEDILELADAISFRSPITHIDSVPIRRPHDPPREPVHVWIDFSQPAATLNLLESTSEPVVIGTTGHTPDQLEKIEAHSKERPLVLAPNMSIGIALFHRFLNSLPPAQTLFPMPDLVVQEEHHRNKKDLPSGTANALVQSAKARGYLSKEVFSVRAGDIRGTHTLRFIFPNEELKISHQVLDRSVFAFGALKAAVFVAKIKKPGKYSFEDVLRGEM